MSALIDILIILAAVSFIGFLISYFVLLLPPLIREGKASLLKSVLLPGQDLADIYAFYDLARLDTKGNLVFRLKIWKTLGYCFVIFVLFV